MCLISKAGSGMTQRVEQAMQLQLQHRSFLFARGVHDVEGTLVDAVFVTNQDQTDDQQ
jgi:hypothetical protein